MSTVEQALNSWPSCLCLKDAGITDVCHQAWLIIVFKNSFIFYSNYFMGFIFNFEILDPSAVSYALNSEASGQ